MAYGKRGRQVLFDRDVAMELRIACPVGDAKSTPAENGDYFIATDDGAKRQRHEILVVRSSDQFALGINHRWLPPAPALEIRVAVDLLRSNRRSHRSL